MIHPWQRLEKIITSTVGEDNQLVRMEIGKAFLKGGWAISIKIQNVHTFCPSNPTFKNLS